MTTQRVRRTVVLDVSGEMDLLTAGAFSAQLFGATDAVSAHCVVLDLSGVTFMDVAGLCVLTEVRHRLRREGKDLQLRGISPPLWRLMSRAGTSNAPPLLTAVPDLDAAS